VSASIGGCRATSRRLRTPPDYSRRDPGFIHRVRGHYHNPAIKAFYQRLRAAGKPKKVARCAAARKLLHQAWALGSKLQRFDPGHKQQQHEALPQLAA
jgi:hypothetical protein